MYKEVINKEDGKVSRKKKTSFTEYRNLEDFIN